MSDTEEVVIPRATKTQLKVNTKPEIAREKLKEKRERLKKEKENMLIEEAKKRLVSETEQKQKEDAIAKQQEEEKKKADPSYSMLLKMEEMMRMMSERHVPFAASPLDDYRGTGKAAKAKGKAKKVEIPEPEPEEEPEKPKRKPRVPKEPKTPKPIENIPKRKKKVVYLQQQPIPETSTQFVGYDIAPPQEPIQHQPSQGLLSALMNRRNMNSFNF